MAEAKALAHLAVQKQLLVVESAANRLALAAELRRLATPLNWLDRVTSKTRPYMLLAAPIAGFLATRRLPGVLRWLSRGLRVLRIFKVLRIFSRRRS